MIGCKEYFGVAALKGWECPPATIGLPLLRQGFKGSLRWLGRSIPSPTDGFGDRAPIGQALLAQSQPIRHYVAGGPANAEVAGKSPSGPSHPQHWVL